MATTTKKKTKSTASSTAKKKTSSSGKKPTTRKTQNNKKPAENPTAALWLFAASLILFAIVFIEGKNIWTVVHNFLYGVFSFYSIVLPILLLLLSISIGLGKQVNSIGFRVTLVFLAIVLLCSITQNFTLEYPENGFLALLRFTYQNGAASKGGGVAALLVGYPLTLLCGNEAALVSMFILLFVDLMLLTGTSVGGLMRFIKRIPVGFAEGVKNAFAAKDDGDEDEDDQVLKRKEAAKEKKQLEEQLKHLERQQKEAEKEAKRIEEQRKAKEKIKEQPKEESKEEPVEKPKKKTAVKPVEEKEDIPMPTEPPAEKEEIRPDAEMEDLIHRILGQQQEYKLFDDAAAEGEAKAKKEEKTVEQPAPQPIKEAASEPEKPAEKQPEKGDPVPVNIEVEQIKKAYEYPSVMLLNQPKENKGRDVSEELRQNASLLVETLESFGVKTKLVDISRGPTVTRYELQPAAGVKISKVTGLADDIALNLAAAGVRIEAPIPNKAAIGIEVPNKATDIVTIREIIDTPEFKNAKSKLTVALGKDIAGNVITTDLSKMPHTLIAGSTGSGKSVCINSLLMSILYKASPSEVRLLLVDPKVVELGIYNGIPHLLVPVVTDPRKAAGALQWAVNEMLKRYNEFADKGVRDIKGFNELAANRSDLEPMPQIVIVIDELADLMMAAPSEVEDSICRLAQMARAAGMYLVIATQRPSVDVITGIIKANIPSRIAFAVSSQVDSRTILDAAGAEKLLGKGDMLFYPSGSPKPTRVQGCFVTDKEVEEVVRFVSGDHQVYDNSIMDAIEQNAVPEKGESNMSNAVSGSDTDPLFDQAVACVMEAGQASTSYIQRKLKVGYARAARLMDEMEEKGIVGPSEGSKPRQILRGNTES